MPPERQKTVKTRNKLTSKIDTHLADHVKAWALTEGSLNGKDDYNQKWHQEPDSLFTSLLKAKKKCQWQKTKIDLPHGY